MNELFMEFMQSQASINEKQININQNNFERFKMLGDLVEKLYKIVEDHENDMMKMAEKINELQAEISKMKES